MALSRGRRADTHATTDAASARLQLLADQFLLLDFEQQRQVAALVAALANGTPDGPKAVRSAVREFLTRTFSTADLAYVAKSCIDGMARKGGAE